ncbi:MAG: surface lipoprotein assembly modifier [Marinosulfonomonas sp.]|nr:surface lipoprotein assembly modifier [Marinosulfonomonas sp.]
MGIEQSRGFGMDSLRSGRPDVAEAIALALLKRDPNDVQALLMLSGAQTALGKGPIGAKTGKQAYAIAKTRIEMFAAARAVASAKTLTENYTQAEIWLRRALQHAPADQYRNIVKRDFRFVKRRNPLQLNFTFGVAPSSNINNGANSDRAWLFGLPFILSGEAQALSGVEYSAGLRTRYRISQNATRATDIGLMLYGTSYTLSQSAQQLAPNASASDYSYFIAELSARKRILLNAGKTHVAYSLALGQNWYGGKPLTRYFRLGIDRQHSISPKVFTKFGFTIDHQDRIQIANRALDTLAVSGAISFRNKTRGTLTLGLDGRKANGSDRGGEYSSLSASIGYSFGSPILGADTTVTISAENRTFPFSVYSSDGRNDKRLSAGITMLFSKADVYGFSPMIAIKAAKTDSNIDLYNAESFTVKLGFRSTF